MTNVALFALGVNFLAVLAITGLFANAGKLFGPRGVHQGDAEAGFLNRLAINYRHFSSVTGAEKVE